uniref:Uncharacterized protein n=1 Tax=Entomoneis paludosa TaxID=265537 RepID=A0A7S3DN44_9STRA
MFLCRKKTVEDGAEDVTKGSSSSHDEKRSSTTRMRLSSSQKSTSRWGLLTKEESQNTIASCSEGTLGDSFRIKEIPAPPTASRIRPRGSDHSSTNDDTPIQEFYLKKRRPGTGRNGLAWQEDPTGQTWLHHGRNWPRDYATVRGTVVTVAPSRSHKSPKQWLLATHVRQPDETTWTQAPKGAALPLFYSNLYCLVPTSGSRSLRKLEQVSAELSVTMDTTKPKSWRSSRSLGTSTEISRPTLVAAYSSEPTLQTSSKSVTFAPELDP